MVRLDHLLKPLTDKLMKQVDSYSQELMQLYTDNINERCSAGEICKEYLRFQLRVIRMLSSLAETGIVDFSSTKSRPLKYIVADETTQLVEKILESYPISEDTKRTSVHH